MLLFIAINDIAVRPYFTFSEFMASFRDSSCDFQNLFFKRIYTEPGMEMGKNQAICRTDDNLSLCFDFKFF